jgi:hypothetical protein
VSQIVLLAHFILNDLDKKLEHLEVPIGSCPNGHSNDSGPLPHYLFADASEAYGPGLFELACYFLLLLPLPLPLRLVGAAANAPPDEFSAPTCVHFTLGSPVDPFSIIESESSVFCEIAVLPRISILPC